MGRAKVQEHEEPQTNGAAEPEQDPQELQMATLTGDVRDEILREFKLIAKPWQKMNESEQERLIHRATDVAASIVDRAVDIVASRGCEHFLVKLGDVTFSREKGIVSKIGMAFSKEGIAALANRSGDIIVLVARDAHEFAGMRAEAQPEVVGDLAMPKEQIDPATGEITSRPPAPSEVSAPH